MMDAFIVHADALTCLGSGDELWENLAAGRSGLSSLATTYPQLRAAETSKVGVLAEINSEGSRVSQLCDRVIARLIDHTLVRSSDLILFAGNFGDIECDTIEALPTVFSRQWRSKGYDPLPRCGPQISTACSSGSDAFSLSALLLDQQAYSVITIIAIDSLECGKILQHLALGTQSPTSARPFDRNRDGTSFGEGGACVTLANRSGVRKLLRPALARVSGIGMSCDALDITAPDPSGRFPALAIQAALNQAGLGPSDIQCIKAHGSGTALNDAAEAATLHTIFGTHLANLPCFSTKGAIGHLLGATGLVELCCALRVLTHQQVIGSAGLAELDPALELTALPQGEHHEMRISNLLALTCGFGGLNSAIILSQIT